MLTVLRRSRKILFSLGVFIGAATLLPVSAAHAGFEWTPPAASAQPGGPVVQAVPVPDVDAMPPVDAEPMMMPGTSGMTGNAVIDAQPLAPPPVASAPVSDDRDYAVAEGFGRDIPLALVMQQIVPPGYAYSFDPSINPGTRVSWDGGRPWNQVLNDAVAPHGLEAIVIDMTVHVREASAQRALAAPASLQTPAQQTSMHSMMSEIARAAGATPSGMIRAETKDEPAAPVAAAPEMITDPARLAEIGRSDATAYHPSYPRRTPVSAPRHAPAAQPAPNQPAPAETVTFNGPRAEPVPAATGAQEPMPIVPAESIASPAPQSIVPKSPAAATATPSVLDPHAVNSWRAEKGASLKKTLTSWSGMAGVQLYWDAAGDYALPVSVHANGTFPEVLMQTLSAFGEAGDRPVGALHPNLPAGPSVLIIRSSGSGAAVN